MNEHTKGNPAVFLDRDGTLNLDMVEYLTKTEDFHLLDGVTQALRRLRAAGYLLVVVTNQACLAKGLLKERGLKKIHDHMEKLLAQDGATLDAIHFCPYHPEGTVEKYSQESELRKPQPGMLLEAAKQLNIDLERSWMIGNMPRDAQAGKTAGCRTILLIGDDLYEEIPDQPPDTQHADFTAENLLQAAEIVIQKDLGSEHDQHEPPKKTLRPKPTQLDSRRLLSDILRELRHQRISPHHREFSVSKMLAGIAQCGVILCLVMAYAGFSSWTARALLVCLMVGLILQLMVVALLLLHRSS